MNSNYECAIPQQLPALYSHPRPKQPRGAAAPHLGSLNEGTGAKKKASRHRLALALTVSTGPISVLHRLNHIVLHQADFHPTSGRMLRGGSRASNGRISHAHRVDPVDGNLMVEDEIAYYRVRHLL